MTYYVETERLILRELQDSDIKPMFNLDSNPLVHRYLGNTPIQTLEEAAQNIATICNQYKTRGIGRWAVIEKFSGDFLGWSGLKLNKDQEVIYGNKAYYDIGYRLLPEYWGKGYATESATASLNYGFNSMQLPTIVGLTETKNKASNAVLKKIGLNFETVFSYKDVFVNWYQINKQQWENNA